MKQKLIISITTILAIVCLVGVFTFSSLAETTSGYYTYTVLFGEATITDVDTNIGGEVIIPSELDGYPVTGINSYAFEKCSKISSIVIPEHLTYMGHSVFSECISLEVVNFNARNCTQMGIRWEYPVFKNCPNLKTVNIGNGVKTIPDYAFFGCSSLSSVIIPNSVTSIGSYAFSGCNSLSNITIPNGVTSIGRSAFEDCNGLTSVIVPNSVTGIGEGAFDGCTNIASITLPFVGASRYADEDENAVFGYIFGISSGLAQVKQYFANKDGTYQYYNIPASLRNVTITDATRIPYGAFYNCDMLTSIRISDNVTRIGSYAFYKCEGITSVTIPNSVTSIGVYAFAYCDGLTSVIVPNSVTSIGEGTFCRCDQLVSMTLPFVGISRTATEGTYYSVFGIVFGQGDGPSGDLTQQYYNTANYSYSYYYIPWRLKSVTITDATNIPYGAFYNCDMLTNINLSNSVTSIGKRAFYNCERITSVTIPDNVTRISEKTFCYCKDLTSVILPDSVTSIGDSAFYDCYELSTVWYAAGKPRRAQIYNGTNNDYLEDATWQYALCEEEHNYNQNQGLSCGICGVSKKPDIPVIESQTSNSAILVEIDGCEYSKDGITWQSSNVFDNLLPNTTYTFYQRVQESETNFVSAMSEGVTVVLQPDIVDTGTCGLYGDNIKWQLDSNGLLTISGVGEMNDAILRVESKESITNVVILEGVTNVGDYVFNGFSNMQSISLASSVKDIGDYAFQECSCLVDVNFPADLESIGDGVFWNCSSLTDVTISQNIVSIGTDTFYGCNNLKFNYYKNGMYLGNAENPYIALIDTEIDNFVGFEFAEDISCIGGGAFSKCESLLQINIPNSITCINRGTFNECRSLEQVSLPNSITHIGPYAFCYCNNLTQVEIPNNVTEIEYGAFFGCDSLESIKIPNSITKIGHSCFEHCKKLASIELPKNITSISGRLFADCDALTSIKIPDGVTEICESAFEGSNNLVVVELPDTVNIIGVYAFNYCNKLEAIWYQGSETDRNAIDMELRGDGNETLNNAIWHYNTCKQTHTYHAECDSTCADCDWMRTVNITTETEHVFSLNGNLTCIGCGYSKQPEIPALESKMSGTVVLKANEAYEYSLDGEVWQDSHIFENLEGNCSHIFYQRVKETSVAKVSSSSEGLTIFLKSSQNQPESPCIEEVTGTSIVLKQIDNGEYSMDGITWQTSNVFSGLSPVTEYSFYQRYAETDNHEVSEISIQMSVTTQKGIQNIPPTPTLLSKTQNSVILTLVEGYEYSIDGINWQLSNEFTGLEAGEYYHFSQRVAETDIYYASGASQLLTVQTDRDNDYILGDLDGDFELTDWDGVMLARYLAGWQVEISVLEALDIDGDGEASDWDGVMLDRYLAGWNIQIGGQS